MKVELLLGALNPTLGKALTAPNAGKGAGHTPMQIDRLWVVTCADAARQAASATLAGDTSMFLRATQYLHGAARRSYQDAYYAALDEQANERVQSTGEQQVIAEARTIAGDLEPGSES